MKPIDLEGLSILYLDWSSFKVRITKFTSNTKFILSSVYKLQ